jgi:hypothetical protein
MLPHACTSSCSHLVNYILTPRQLLEFTLLAISFASCLLYRGVGYWPGMHLVFFHIKMLLILANAINDLLPESLKRDTASTS